MDYELLKSFKESSLEGNELKTVIQKLEVDTWLREFEGVAYFINYTGFGKTNIGVSIIQRFLAKYDGYIGIIVPTKLIKEEWQKRLGDLAQFVEIHIIGTYVKTTTIRKKWDILFVDELHRICNENAYLFSQVIKVSTFDRFCGLTATLDDDKRKFLGKLGIQCAFEITLQEGYALGLVPDYKLYNLSSELEPYEDEEYQRWQEIYSAQIQYFYPIATKSVAKLIFACTVTHDARNKPIYTSIWIEGKGFVNQSNLDWCKEVASHYNISIDAVKRKANIWRNAMSSRNSVLDNSVNKLNQAKELVHLYKGLKTIVFTDNIDTANFFEIGNDQIHSIHSKLSDKKRAVLHKAFLDGEYNQIATVKAYDEGVDAPGLVLGVQHYYTTVPLRFAQRLGRVLRLDANNPDKLAVLVSLHTKHKLDENGQKVLYQDEVQLTKSQVDFANEVKWIDSIDQITWKR